MTWTEAQVRATAQERRNQALSGFRLSGFAIDGEVGGTSPVDAVADVLLRDGHDAYALALVSTAAAHHLPVAEGRRPEPHRPEHRPPRPPRRGPGPRAALNRLRQPARVPAKICQARALLATRLSTTYTFSPNR